MALGLPTAVLGRTGLKVTRLGYGTALSRALQNDEWDRLLNAVLDSGINFVDTANDYGFPGNPTEVQIGRHLAHRRSEYYLATKCGCSTSGHIWTRENAFRGLHESLKRMKTDYVDVMQYHNPTVEECEKGNLITALKDMRKEGKVRWIGISTTLPHLPTFLEWGVFDVLQVSYSALGRAYEDWITKAAQSGMGIIINSGVAHGEPNQDSMDVGHIQRWKTFNDAGLDELVEEGESRTTFILRYALTHPYSDTNIVGTSRIQHLEENVAGMMRGPLPKDVYAEAKHRLDAIGEKPKDVR